jgi:uncharacterized membrane protein
MFFTKKSSVRQLLTEENKTTVLNAIQEAEQQTSGEVRVHIEANLKSKNALDRAVELFEKLGMFETELRNGVLIYVALDDRQFAIIGDQGINEKVGQDFWDYEKDEMRAHIIGGIVFAIKQVGEKLKEFFPYQENDVNELSDDISTGE